MRSDIVAHAPQPVGRKTFAVRQGEAPDEISGNPDAQRGTQAFDEDLSTSSFWTSWANVRTIWRSNGFCKGDTNSKRGAARPSSGTKEAYKSASQQCGGAKRETARRGGRDLPGGSRIHLHDLRRARIRG
jgi:hypothetical protein